MEEPCWLLMRSAPHRTVKHTHMCEDSASVHTTHRPKLRRNPNPHTLRPDKLPGCFMPTRFNYHRPKDETFVTFLNYLGMRKETQVWD